VGRIVASLLIAAIGALPAVASEPAMAAGPATVDAGALRATVDAEPWRLRFDGPSGQAALEEFAGTGNGPVGALGFRTPSGWFRATRVTAAHREGEAYVATLATTDPAGRTLSLRVAPAAAGVLGVEASVQGGTLVDVLATGVSFVAPPGERHLGFGERSNAVDQRGREVENYVAEGPYQEVERPFLAGFVPAAGYHPRDDATYFPIPWLLSSRGIGVLVTNDETSVFRLSTDRPDAWSLEAATPRLGLRVVAGPEPADVVRRFSELVGRQPPIEAPFFLGPWWQPKGDEASNIATLKAAGAIGSVVQTYTHYLPCGDQVEQRERERTERFHAAGLAVTTYFNPMVCTQYTAAYEEARQRGVLTRNMLGEPYEYRYTGSSQFFVGQVDFTHPDAFDYFGDLLDEAVGHGYDGWMEDFGEYTPLDARGYDGSTGEAYHNKYVVGYHAAARAYARDRAPRPLARFNRSGWTGAARHSQIVWGGDPTTGWGFDGLESAIMNGLTMGLSGVSLWGSDIGGFFALSEPQTTPELLARWIEFGFASGVMRTQANGFQLQSQSRAQIFDAGLLPVWARYAKLRTQLYPYLSAAQAEYDRSGMPLMRHLALAFPDDPLATVRADEYMLGDDLLVAPVIRPDERNRTLYLPPGRWIDWWRSVTLDARGAPRLGSPRVLSGARDVTLPAPLRELPLLVPEGAVIPLLDPSVETLADYGDGAAVRLRDRIARMRLLVWPRGRRTASLGGGSETVTSEETPGGWELDVQGNRMRRYEIEAALGSLSSGAFEPCRVSIGRPGRGSVKRWHYDGATGVLRLRLDARTARVVVRRC
jgi:alpha-glucosidase (family GH31 glycosyl hydrolase)